MYRVTLPPLRLVLLPPFPLPPQIGPGNKLSPDVILRLGGPINGFVLRSSFLLLASLSFLLHFSFNSFFVSLFMPCSLVLLNSLLSLPLTFFFFSASRLALFLLLLLSVLPFPFSLPLLLLLTLPSLYYPFLS